MRSRRRKRSRRLELGARHRGRYRVPVITRVFTTLTGTVRLRFVKVVSWKRTPIPGKITGDRRGKAGAAMVSPRLPRTRVLASLRAFRSSTAITDAAPMGTAAISTSSSEALERGRKSCKVQLREAGLGAEERRSFSRARSAARNRYVCKSGETAASRR